jgi:nicotinate-nucleotide pyrophosphorylase (carboxylating)
MASQISYFLSHDEPRLDQERLDSLIKHALFEDIGNGDITTQLTIPKDKAVKAVLVAKEDFLVCGIGVIERVFNLIDKDITFEPLVHEGHVVKKGKSVARMGGKAHGILSAERVGLNILSLLSGIASKTREYVTRIEPYKTKITDTRKTLPGLRALQKYAVRVGGGFNHRMGLDEMILIKDNHLQVMNGYKALPKVPKGYKIEIEVQNLAEFTHALRFKPDVIMLDNMDLADIKKAVEVRNNTVFNSHHPTTKLEVSGGINLDNVKQMAATGVDIISIGDLTHNVRSVDISMDIV